jgi:hypothetical protein
MKLLLSACAAAAILSAQRVPPDFGMMTWPEVKKAQAEGKLTALVYNGGTEQRGPRSGSECAASAE